MKRSQGFARLAAMLASSASMFYATDPAGVRASRRDRRRADPANAAIQQEIIDAAVAKRQRRALRPQGRS